MRLKIGKPTKTWAFVRSDGTMDIADWLGPKDPKPSKALADPGETIERVLVTVERLPKKGKRNG